MADVKCGNCKHLREKDYVLEKEGTFSNTYAYFCEVQNRYVTEGKVCDDFESVPTLRDSTDSKKCSKCKKYCVAIERKKTGIFSDSYIYYCLESNKFIEKNKVCDSYEDTTPLKESFFFDNKCEECKFFRKEEQMEEGWLFPKVLYYCSLNNRYVKKDNNCQDFKKSEVKDSSCFAIGTQITMADGTLKKVEELNYGDKVLVFNHNTGKLDSSAIIFNAHKDDAEKIQNVLNLTFSNGNTLKIVLHHGLFDCTLNEYVEISLENVEKFIGHKFYNVSYLNGEFVSEKVSLVKYSVTSENVKVYSPITANYINCFGGGVLTAPGLYNALMNVFKLDDNMKVDSVLKQKDVDKYGLYKYSVFEKYISYEIFNAFGGEYLKIAVEKGLTTFEEIIKMILDFDVKNSTIV